ncbi:hypothetical protein CTAYLR_008312 [Chrysophaeum taylorii]|uniref:JmjC domain-containing protein n=1 Tax=Chrysophaeum taylorii TaxID=2483200 RepID=A0AAD7U9B8_9STRA|nr:hypothetical protein CTAYLR_008312 [Chrysophaeum taylorii]
MVRRKEKTCGTVCKYCVGVGLLSGGYWLGYWHSSAILPPSHASEPKEGALDFPEPRGSVNGSLDALMRAPLDHDWTGKIPGDFEEYLSDCSKPPQEGYPRRVPVRDIIANWNPDEAAYVPEKMYRTICRFDYQTQYDLAMAYRDAEVPFQVYNVPEMNEVVRKWSDDTYLGRKLGKSKYKCEASNPGGEVNHGANHFMYTNGRSTGLPPPIKHVRLSWTEWLGKVRDGEEKPVDSPDSRFYFRFSASSPSDNQAGWLFRELSFFQPKPSLFLREPRGQRGIHCRFGMRAVIAEAHWDGSRNMIAQFYGRRRYILVDPDDSCDMYLLAKTHPSGRHSEVDWSKPDSWANFPKFPTMPAHEVVQRPGDFLYLPTYYLHYIISIDRNYQCNTRSGRDDRQTAVVNQCTPGFQPSPKAAKAAARGKQKLRAGKQQQQQQQQQQQHRNPPPPRLD